MRDIGPVSPSPPEGLVDALHRAQRPLLLTGAGMSAESGIATFRGGEDSLWSRFDPMRLATPEAFDADPPLVWAWYRWRMAKIAQAQPHPGHRALAALAELKPGVVLATQNVDDLHERAGSADVLHLHGRIAATRCRDCDADQPVAIDPAWAEAPELRVAPPRCVACGGPLRPGVVWFGESLPVDEFTAAGRAARAADLVLVIGTSGLVHPAAGLPDIAPETCPLYEINPQPSALSARMEGLWRASAGEALPRLVHALRRA